jgi:tetratricopeptide (TPR) repeat protein
MRYKLIKPVIGAFLATVMLVLGCISPALEQVTKGDNFLRQKQWEDAIIAYTKAIEIDPNNAVAYNQRGLAYMYQVKSVDKMLEDFNKAIELDPRLAMAYYNRGTVYDSKGDYDKAIADFTRVIELSPKFAEVYALRGLSYKQSGNLVKAQADFGKAKELGWK